MASAYRNPSYRRRPLWAAGAASVALIALSGCAPSEPATEVSAAAADLLPAGECATEYPLTVEAAWGTSDVWYPLEPIAGTHPDLIMITTSTDLPDGYAKLSKLSPVFGPEPAAELPSWQERLRQLGTLLDLSERAVEVIAEDYEYFAGSRDAHPGLAGKTVALLDSPVFQNIDAVRAGNLNELNNVDYSDIVQNGVVIACGFGLFGWAINSDTGPVPHQALATFIVPVIAEVLAV